MSVTRTSDTASATEKEEPKRGYPPYPSVGPASQPPSIYLLSLFQKYPPLVHTAVSWGVVGAAGAGVGEGFAAKRTVYSGGGCHDLHHRR